MSEHVDVSVIVSTYNRCALLPAALDGLLAQDTSGVSYEVILVDNNSTDGTRAVVESYLPRGAGKLRYLFEARQGVSYGRNAGIAAARASLLAFTDDDIVVEPGWVARIKRAFDDHPAADFIGGKILPRWETPPPAWLTYEHWSPLALVDYGELPFAVNSARPVCLLTANAAFRREAFERVGLFSPDLQRVKDGIGSMEDQELETRLCLAGRQGAYVPDLVVYSPVQADRLTKAYHRRWHRGHGHFHALMRVADMEGGRVRLYDMPGHLFRQAIRNGLAFTSLMLRGQRDAAFLHETQLCFFIGFLRKRRQQFLADRRRSGFRETVQLVRALLGKKKRSELAV